MQLSTLGLFTFLLLFSACDKDDDSGFNGGGTTENPSNLSSTIFTAVLCTDIAANPSCDNSFAVLPSVRIRLFTSSIARADQDPVFSEGNTAAEGKLIISGLEAGTWFWSARRADDLNAELKQGEFNINRNTIPQLRLEWEE